MRVAVELRCCTDDVYAAFVKLREPRPEGNQRGLTEAEVAAFKAAETHPGYLALWTLALGTAMRDDEIRHMEASDIRTAEIIVTPKPGWTTKGYRYRAIPVSPATVAAARAYLAARDTVSADPKTVRRRLQATREAAGIDWHFSMHDFRRAWASHMLKAGHRIERISQWLGHRDVLTTLRYLRLIDPAMPKPDELPWRGPTIGPTSMKPPSSPGDNATDKSRR